MHVISDRYTGIKTSGFELVKENWFAKIFDYGKEAHRKQNIFWICKSNEKYIDF